MRKKQQDANTLVIRPGSNLMDATTTESIEKLVNRVRIVGSDYQLIDTKEDTASVEKYGVMQRVLQQSGRQRCRGQTTAGGQSAYTENYGELSRRCPLDDRPNGGAAGGDRGFVGTVLD